ncbi:MAG: hypothetical protein ACLT5C_08565 [Blautia hansenii]
MAGTNRKKFKKGSKILPAQGKQPTHNPTGTANTTPKTQPFSTRPRLTQTSPASVPSEIREKAPFQVSRGPGRNSGG